MTFMNKKEEVLDIKLTQYGKKMLSNGVFDPVYYSFHDEGVLYDSKYASFEENQNMIEGRILEDTPSLRTQHNFTSVDDKKPIIISTEEIKKSTLKKLGTAGVSSVGPSISSYTPAGVGIGAKAEIIDIYQIPERQALGIGLGNSELNNQNSPTFQVKVYDGEITSVNNDYTGRFGEKIPQINCDFTVRAQIKNVSDANRGQEAISSVISPIAPDGTYLLLENPDFLIEILENNTDFESENFEIEVFTVGDDVPLYFANETKNKQVINNILVKDKPENDEMYMISNRYNVEYYFDLDRDSEINPKIISKASAQFKSKGFYNDVPREPTRKTTPLKISDIYSTTTRPEDIEDCS